MCNFLYILTRINFSFADININSHHLFILHSNLSLYFTSYSLSFIRSQYIQQLDIRKETDV